MGWLDSFFGRKKKQEEPAVGSLQFHENPLYAGGDTEHEGVNPLYEPAVRREREQAPQAPAPVPEAEPEIVKGPAKQSGQLEVLREMMQASKKSRLMGGDSVEYRQITDSLTAIVTGRTTMVTAANFSEEYGKMMESYSALLEGCDTYLETRAGASTGVGQARLQLVQMVQEAANREFAAIKDCGGKITATHPMTWAQIIADARTEKIDIAGKDVRTYGKGSSSRKRFTHEGRDVFFTRDLTLLPANEAALRGIDSVAPDKKALFGQCYKHPETMGYVQRPFWAGYGSEKDCLERWYQAEKNEARKATMPRNIMECIQKEIGAQPALKAAFDLIEREVNEGVAQDEDRQTFHFDDMDFCVEFADFCVETTRGKSGSENAQDIGGIAIGSNISKRNVGMSRIADLLGIGHLIARSTSAVIQQDGQETPGVIMDKAQGEDVSGIANEKLRGADVSSGALQRQLISLQLLDTLCGQVDRKKDNIFYDFRRTDAADAERVTGVQSIQGIDNDLAFGQITDLSSRNQELNAFLGENGRSTLPVVDKAVAERILALSDEVVRFTLMDILPPNDIDATLNRLHDMQAALEDLRANGSSAGIDPFVEEGQWGEDTRRLLIEASQKQNRNRVSVGNYYSRMMSTVGDRDAIR